MITTDFFRRGKKRFIVTFSDKSFVQFYIIVYIMKKRRTDANHIEGQNVYEDFFVFYCIFLLNNNISNNFTQRGLIAS